MSKHKEQCILYNLGLLGGQVIETHACFGHFTIHYFIRLIGQHAVSLDNRAE